MNIDPSIAIPFLVYLMGPSFMKGTSVACSSPDQEYFAMFSFRVHEELELINHLRYSGPNTSLEFYETDDFKMTLDKDRNAFIEGRYTLEGHLPKDRKVEFPMTLDKDIAVNCRYLD